jgi:hypothetical protein
MDYLLTIRCYLTPRIECAILFREPQGGSITIALPGAHVFKSCAKEDGGSYEITVAAAKKKKPAFCPVGILFNSEVWKKFDH